MGRCLLAILAEQLSLVSVTDGLQPDGAVTGEGRVLSLMEQRSTAALRSRVAESRIFRPSVSVGGDAALLVWLVQGQ